MGLLEENKIKKIQGLLGKSAAPKKIASSVKTAYTKIGKRLHFKGASRASNSIEAIEDVTDNSPAQEKECKAKEKVTLENSSVCNHDVGYLATRDSKGSIPDACMTCKDLIECMKNEAKN
jgi:hypothetical protein